MLETTNKHDEADKEASVKTFFAQKRFCHTFVEGGACTKMLENRPDDALGSLVETVETVQTVETEETVEALKDCRD